MDIIKSILHVFKKSDNAFKVMHPETESACITDWNTGIVNTLASTGLSSLVNVLSSDSLLALLIKKVFDAMGVKYSLGQNGYVCWGALFGGVITQWGLVHQTTSQLNTVTPPLTFTTFLTGVATDAGGGMYSKGFGCDGKNFLIYTSTYGAVDTRWIAITR
jgi:hypothetical protein